MYNQTIEMMKVLPAFSDAIRLADRKGSSDWEIVRWRDVPPSDLRPGQETAVTPGELDSTIKLNRFDSRTSALRASAAWVRSRLLDYSQRDHWAVWRWEADEQVWYQTALPVNRPGRMSHTAGSISPVIAQASEVVVLTGRTLAEARRLATDDGTDVQTVIRVALREYDRMRFFARAQSAYRKLKADPEAWNEAKAESRALEGTLSDGLDPEVWVEAGLTKEKAVA